MTSTKKSIIEVLEDSRSALEPRFPQLYEPESLTWLGQCAARIERRFGLSDFELMNANSNGSAVVLKSGDKVVRISVKEPPYRVWHEDIVQPLSSQHKNGIRCEVMNNAVKNIVGPTLYATSETTEQAINIQSAKAATLARLNKDGIVLKSGENLESNWLITVKDGKVSAQILDGDAVEIKKWDQYSNYLWNKGITTYVAEAWLKQPPLRTLLDASRELARTLTFGYADF